MAIRGASWQAGSGSIEQMPWVNQMQTISEVLEATIEAQLQVSTMPADRLMSAIGTWVHLAEEALISRNFDDALFYVIGAGAGQQRAVSLFGADRVEQMLAAEIIG